MAKLTPGMKQDWKHRPSGGGRPMKRIVRLLVAGTMFLALIGVLIWFLLPPAQQRTYFFAANPIEYDLLATMPLVHSSVAEVVSDPENHDPKSFHIGRVTVGDFPPLDQVAREASAGHVPGTHDACILYVQAHTLRYDTDDKPHVVVAMPRFLRNSLADWQQDGVLDLKVLLDWLETAHCPLKLLLLDAGTIVVDGEIDLYENNFAAAIDTEMRERNDSNLFVITSHDDGQKSLSRSLDRNSIFSQAIQEAMVGRNIVDQKNDHQLTLDELYHHILVRVKDQLGNGAIPQTPRLFQGGQGMLTANYPARFVCRYLVEEPKDEKKEGDPDKPQEAATPPADPKPAASDSKDTAKDKADADKEKDPRWVLLDEIWQLREQLAAPPAERGKRVWSPIDFAPQDFRRLDDYLIGFQFRLLYNNGTVEQSRLSKMKGTLASLLQGIEAEQAVSLPDGQRENLPDQNLVEDWNNFIRTPHYAAWSADLTDAGAQARSDLLAWNYSLYYVPQMTRLFDLTGLDQELSDYQSILRGIRDISVAMVTLAGTQQTDPVLDRVPLSGAIAQSVEKIELKRQMMGTNLQIASTKGNPNAAMGDVLRLIAYLRTSLPSSADRLAMTKELRAFSRQPVPPISFIADSISVLSQLSSGPLPRASSSSMEQLRGLYAEVAAADQSVKADDPNVFFQLAKRVPTTLPASTPFSDQVRYNILVRTLDWRVMPQTIVRAVAPLPVRFPVRERTPRLMVQSSGQSQTVNLERIDGKVEFKVNLAASNFTTRDVSFTVEYDHSALDVGFKNGNFNSQTGILDYPIDGNGPLTIEGYVSAKVDREMNAARRNLANARQAQTELIKFSIPADLVPPGGQSSREARIEASLPWANVVELVVQQKGADQPGIFYGRRVQIPLFDNRTSEFRLGVVNRSKISRSVNVSLYPVVRPPGSTMPTGRIFSQNYHRKPTGTGPGSQGYEIKDWRLFSFEQPLANLGPEFVPQGIASAGTLAGQDDVPPEATRIRGRIINAPIESEQVTWLTFQGPPGPPGPDGKPGPSGKVAATDFSDGMLVVIEDQENKLPDGTPLRWLRWVEFVPRHPKEYLDLQTTVVPVNKVRKLDMLVRPIQGPQALPVATWDSEPLVGFLGLPPNLAKVPVRVTWDWDWNNTFAADELIEKQTFGTLNSPNATVNMGAVLNLESDGAVERPVLINIASGEKQPTLRRAFRDVINLKNGKLNADASAGFHTLWLDTYLPHQRNEEKPGKPINVLAERWPADRLPLILPTDTESVDWRLALSTDTNSFNYANQTDPDTIQLGLLEGNNNFLSARPGFTKTYYSNRSFGVTLEKALSDGQLQFAASLEDITVPGLDATTTETFVGNFVVQVRTGKGLVDNLQIPVVIDKDPPTINIGPTQLDIPVNDGQRMTVPVTDDASGIKHLEVGVKGPGDTIGGTPKILEPLVGNIQPNPNDPFQYNPIFRLNIKPADFKWDVDTTHTLRVIAVNRANLRSKPLDLQIRVRPKVASPTDVPPMPKMVIRVQVLFVNGKIATDPKYQPTLKELPIQPQRSRDGQTWIFESTELKPNTNYTLESSARQTSGGIKSAKVTAQASSAKQQSPIYKIKFD